MLALIRALPANVRQRVVVRRSSRLLDALQAETRLSADIVPVANSLLAALRAAKGIDLIHVHEGRSVTVGALRSALGIPFVATRRISKAPKGRASTRWSYSRASRIVCVSDAVRRTMNAYDHRLRTCTIRDCVQPFPTCDPSAARAIRAQHAGRLLFGQVGQLDDAAKGQRVTIAAARELERSLPDLRFLLVGEGRDEIALKAEAQGLSNVRFAGWQAQIQNLYAAIDVLVFPSRSEGLGSSILEAMSFGIPALAARTGGIPEIVQDERNGLLFPPNDSSALAQLVTRLAHDPKLRDRLAQGARETAAAFSTRRIAEQYLELYADVLRSRDAVSSHRQTKTGPLVLPAEPRARE